MDLFSDDSKQRVKEATEIVDLLGSYLPQLRRQGAMFVTNCPWHDDRKPSFQINPSRQTWACWVCDIRGDVFDFVMRREGVDFAGALRILADRAGIEIRRSGRRIEKGSPDDKQTLYEAMKWANSLYHRCLLESTEGKLAREYLAQRGITQESIEKFQLGFSPLANHWLNDHSRSTLWSPPILEACGLMIANERGYGFYERFRGRLMFPILDTLNRTIGFGGRLVPGVFDAENEPPGKYINSPETKLFSKSDNLYGLNLAAPFANRTRQLVVVEGYTDVIGAVQSGVAGVVACLGTAINQRHIKLIKRYADRIVLVLDGDVAGQKRTSEVLDLFVAESVDLRILTLPEGADPFDFVQTRGAEQFSAMIAAAPDALSHRIEIETRGFDLKRDSHRAVEALDRILQTIAGAPASATSTDAAAKMRFDQILARLARQFDIDRRVIETRLADLRRNRRNPAVPDTGKTSVKIEWDKLDITERWLIELLLSNRDTIDIAIEKISPDLFRSQPLRRIFETICRLYHDGEDSSFEGLMLVEEDPALRGLLVRLDDSSTALQSSASLPAEKQLGNIIHTMQSRQHMVTRNDLLGKMERGTLGSESEAELLNRLLHETRERMGLRTSQDESVSSSRGSDTFGSTEFDPDDFPPNDRTG